MIKPLSPLVVSCRNPKNAHEFAGLMHRPEIERFDLSNLSDASEVDETTFAENAAPTTTRPATRGPIARLRRTAFFSLILFVTSTAATFGEPPTTRKFESTRLDHSKLKQWGTRHYSMTYSAMKYGKTFSQKVGRMTLTFEMKKDGKIETTNRTRINLARQKGTIEFVATCHYANSSLLSPTSITVKAVGPDAKTFKDLRLTIRGKKLSIVDTERGRTAKSEAEWPENAVDDLAFFYLVTLLPKEANQRYAIAAYVSTSSPAKSNPCFAECLGPDATTGKPGKRWTQYLRYDNNDRTKASRFWVSDDGVLRRVQLNATNRLDLEPTK